MNRTRIVFIYLVFSIIAAALIGVLVFLTLPARSAISLSEKSIVAAGFLASCVVGISFVLRPNWMRRCTSANGHTGKKHIDLLTRTFRGHHPDCKTFQPHTIKVFKKTWCAGCLGLLSGLLLSLFLIVLYMIVPFHLESRLTLFSLILGFFLITLVYLENIIGYRHAIIHVFFNGLLVFSFFCITISVVELTGKAVYGLLTILFCYLWLDTRIQLSQWHHQRMCYSCAETCKMYVEMQI